MSYKTSFWGANGIYQTKEDYLWNLWYINKYGKNSFQPATYDKELVKPIKNNLQIIYWREKYILRSRIYENWVNLKYKSIKCR